MTTEAGLDFIYSLSSPQAMELVAYYIESKEGRQRIAHTMVNPMRITLDYLSITMITRKSSEWMEFIAETINRINLYRRFLVVISDEEKLNEPYPELSQLYDQLIMKVRNFYSVI